MEAIVRKNAMLFVIMISFLFVTSCLGFMNSRILSRTDSEAIVEGLGLSRAEARMNAEKLAETIFPEFEEYKDAEYNDKIFGDNHSVSSTIICTLYIRKK